MDRYLDSRLNEVGRLRDALNDPARLLREAEGVLAGTPDRCQSLVSFCEEGAVIGAVCSAIAEQRGRRLPAKRASLLRPLSGVQEDAGWTWLSVEDALGLGAPRQWVREWADAHGAGALVRPHSKGLLAEVA